MTLVFVVTAGVLCACGTYLVLGRQLSRVIIGFGLLGHGVNILLLGSGGGGGAPAFVAADTQAGADATGAAAAGATADAASGDVVAATATALGERADPLPQALVLTAIVITFGVIAFLLALAFRSWQITDNDEVEDDVEDRRIARAASAEGGGA